jgi:hypothetical protein
MSLRFVSMTLNQKFKLVPVTGPRVDQLLEHVNLEKWQRPAPLLRLVAYWSTYPQFAPISRSDIVAALGRSEAEARYDHAVMIRMAAQRILHRLPGRPDAWRVNPDLLHWRGIPGIPSWRAVALSFLAGAPENRAPVSVNGAGRSVELSVNRPAFSPFPVHPLSVDPYHLAAHDQSFLAHLPGETPPGLTLAGAPPSALHNSSERSIDLSSSREAQKKKKDAQRQAFGWVVALVSEKAETSIFGPPEAKILEAAERLGDPDELRRVAATTAGMRNGVAAAERFALGAASSIARRCQRCFGAGVYLEDMVRRECDHQGQEA